jgi:hypothetical protein
VFKISTTRYGGTICPEKKLAKVLEKAETILMKETIEEVKQKLSKFGCIHKSKVAHFTP